MSLHEINWTPEDRQLRQFGWIALAALPLAGAVLHVPRDLLGGLVALGIVAAGLAHFQPSALRWPFLTLSLLTWPIGIVVSEIILLVVFFGLFTPLAAIARIVGRDALDRHWQPEARSYWRPHASPADAARYFQQY